jgi:hypothetical protein
LNFIKSDKEKDYDSLDNDNRNKDKNNNNNIENIQILDVSDTEKQTKLIRFAVDYCRSSPNITLKQKSLLNIGWRNSKYNYEVIYEYISYDGEKISVNILILILYIKYNFRVIV